MSYKATKWAFEQPAKFPDMKPGEQVVLNRLADRHNPEFGCFPSEVTIARETNLSDRSVRTHLKSLERRKLIRIESRFRNGRQTSNRYYFAFEDGFAIENFAIAGGKKPQDRVEKNDTLGRKNFPPNPVREPVKESLSDASACEVGANAPEREDPLNSSDKKKIESDFWKFVQNWPNFAGLSKTKSLKIWMAMSEQDRNLAVSRKGEWLSLLKKQGKSFVPAPSTYLQERLFREVQDDHSPSENTQLVHKPFGKGWMYLRLLAMSEPRKLWKPTAMQEKMIAAGADLTIERLRAEYPLIHQMDTEAAGGMGCVASEPVSTDAYRGYVSVLVFSDDWNSWQEWFADQDLPPLPIPEGAGRIDRYVWMPAINPSEFDGALVHSRSSYQSNDDDDGDAQVLMAAQ